VSLSEWEGERGWKGGGIGKGVTGSNGEREVLTQYPNLLVLIRSVFSLRAKALMGLRLLKGVS
jgi:hypothetical protein